MQVTHLGAVFCGFEEFEVGGLRVGQRQVEAVAEFDQRASSSFFWLCVVILPWPAWPMP
jgi:hypothetical protein